MPENITNSSSDKDLILEIKENNEFAFQTLFYKYYKKLIDFCMYRTRDLDVSKDLVQELFTAIWISRDSLDPNKSIKSYLYRSLTNKIINYSKLSSSKTISLDDSLLQHEKSNNISFENQIDINALIEKLPDKLRLTFLLSRVEGFKYSEIAEIFDISVKAVEKRMTKALKMLRKLIK